LPLLPPSDKQTLVLDLDETLVHASSEMPCVPAVPLMVLGKQLWLSIRPHAESFLSSLAVHYELVVWTAGVEAYGKAVVKLLDPSGSLISHSLYRQHCTCLGDGIYAKDLSKLGRDMNSTRIVDNNPVSFSLQPCAGILVPDFVGQREDTFLLQLMRELTPIIDVEMVDVSRKRTVTFADADCFEVRLYDPRDPAVFDPCPPAPKKPQLVRILSSLYVLYPMNI